MSENNCIGPSIIVAKCKRCNKDFICETVRSEDFCRDCTRHIIKSLGERIASIPEGKTLKDLVNCYGEDMPVSVLVASHLTPHEQRIFGLIRKESK